MKLRELIASVPFEKISGIQEIEVAGVTTDSRAVRPGFLFIAKKGSADDGSKYISQAIAAGAVAVVTDSSQAILSGVTHLLSSNVIAVEGQLAAAFFQFPSEELFLAGVTGTSGKTTTTYLIQHLLEREGKPCGLIGTVVCSLGKGSFPSKLTTPDALTNHSYLREMVSNGCRSAVMEVSSHGLEQGRVEKIHFDAAVFTNLTPEHLDYHHTMDAYAAAKAKLFQNLGEEAHAIVNADDPAHAQMLRGCAAQPLTYGIEQSADLRAKKIRFSAAGISFEVAYRRESQLFTSPLIGRFNVYNLLAAIAVGLAHGMPLAHIAMRLSSFTKVPGRLERVPNKKGLSIFVDYAHKYDALKNVLETLREMKKGRLITLFGCGGDRDREKRPKMGAVAEQLSDIVIVTSDNPRTEDPQAIIDEILSGIADRAPIIVEKDRKAAIAQAIAIAQPEDILLIAGKGHETYQIFRNETVHFDDREIIQEIIDSYCESK